MKLLKNLCCIAPYTVSWWIRKLSCIEEVPRFFFFMQFKIKFKNLNWLQLNLNWELIWETWPVHFKLENMWYSMCYGLIFNMILFKFTLIYIENDSMKAHLIFNWLLFNYQHTSIQNYIFNEFRYSPAHMCITFLLSLIKSEFISPQVKFCHIFTKWSCIFLLRTEVGSTSPLYFNIILYLLSFYTL